MSAQRERLEASAANLANSNTTRTSDGKPYRRRDVVFQATEFDAAWQKAGESLLDQPKQLSNGVKAETILAPENEVVMRYLPGHPDADADGYVTFPDVDPLEETVNMISAARSFEANATAFNTAKEIARTSLNLGDA